MLTQEQIQQIKKTAGEFFDKMTVQIVNMEAKKNSSSPTDEGSLEGRDGIDLYVRATDPQILIGQQGQTLFEIQRILRMILNKRIGGVTYLNLDINDYKKQKAEYLGEMAKDIADQVALRREEKSLSPMSSYERRTVHAELSKRADVETESRGEGLSRHIVIKPK